MKFCVFSAEKRQILKMRNFILVTESDGSVMKYYPSPQSKPKEKKPIQRRATTTPSRNATPKSQPGRNQPRKHQHEMHGNQRRDRNTKRNLFGKKSSSLAEKIKQLKGCRVVLRKLSKKEILALTGENKSKPIRTVDASAGSLCAQKDVADLNTAGPACSAQNNSNSIEIANDMVKVDIFNESGTNSTFFFARDVLLSLLTPLCGIDWTICVPNNNDRSSTNTINLDENAIVPSDWIRIEISDTTNQTTKIFLIARKMLPILFEIFKQIWSNANNRRNFFNFRRNHVAAVDLPFGGIGMILMNRDIVDEKVDADIEADTDGSSIESGCDDDSSGYQVRIHTTIYRLFFVATFSWIN